MPYGLGVTPPHKGHFGTAQEASATVFLLLAVGSPGMEAVPLSKSSSDLQTFSYSYPVYLTCPFLEASNSEVVPLNRAEQGRGATLRRSPRSLSLGTL